MSLADIILPLCGTIGNDKAQAIRKACDAFEGRIEALERANENTGEGAHQGEGDARPTTQNEDPDTRRLIATAIACGSFGVAGDEHRREADANLKAPSDRKGRDETGDVGASSPASSVPSPVCEVCGDTDPMFRLGGVWRCSECHREHHDKMRAKAPNSITLPILDVKRLYGIDTDVPAPATGEVPAWIPSVEEMLELIDDGREGDLISLIAIRAPAQPSVEEMAEVRYKALSDAARVCDEIAKLMEVKANDANAQRKNEDEDEFDARADTAKHIGMKIRALAKAALAALPAPDEKPDRAEAVKACDAIIRRIEHYHAKVKGVGAEADSMKLAYCDAIHAARLVRGDVKLGLDALDVTEGTIREEQAAAPDAPKPASEAQGEPPTIEECLDIAREESFKGTGTKYLMPCEERAIAAVRALFLSRAPSPSPALAAIVEAGDAMAATLRLIRNRAPLHEDYQRDIDRDVAAYDRARAALLQEKSQ